MRIYRFDGEDRLAELVRTLYQIDRSGLTVTNVGKQLAKANPSLNLAGKSLGANVPLGTLITVPDIDGTTHTSATAPLQQDAADALPTDNLIDAIGAAIAAAQNGESQRLDDNRRVVSKAIEELGDGPTRAECEQLGDSIDEQITHLEHDRSAMADVMVAAKEALARQRELLQHLPA